MGIALRSPLLFAIVGAESTGKSTLSQQLARVLPELTGLRCAWVPEYLREWCAREGRTPRCEEQAAIADEQAQRIETALSQHDLVLADTTPLMTAAYHRQVFNDRSLDPVALRWQRRCTLTLLTALDLPWQADGLQRDGPQVREPVDATLRELLIQTGLPFTVVGGVGERRVQAALDALTPWLRWRIEPRAGLFTRLEARDPHQTTWRWRCDGCDQPECEHASLLGSRRPRMSLLQGR